MNETELPVISRRQSSIDNLTVNKKWTAAFVRELLPPVRLRFPKCKKAINTLDAVISGRKNADATVSCYLPYYETTFEIPFSWTVIAKALNSDGVLVV